MKKQAKNKDGIKIKNQLQWNNHWFSACQHGDLSLIKDLTRECYVDQGWVNVNAGENLGIRWMCDQGHLEVLDFLINDPELKRKNLAWALKFSDLKSFKEILTWAVRQNKNEVFKFLLKFSEQSFSKNKMNADEMHQAWRKKMSEHLEGEIVPWVCTQGNLDLLKWIFKSKEMKEYGYESLDIHQKEDQSFRLALTRENMDMLQWLIFELGLKKTKDIQEMIKHMGDSPLSKLKTNVQIVESFFQAREEKQSLEKALKGKLKEKSWSSGAGSIDDDIQGEQSKKSKEESSRTGLKVKKL